MSEQQSSGDVESESPFGVKIRARHESEVQMVEETETFSISLRDYLGIRLKSPSHFFRRRWPRQPRSRPRLIIEHQKKTLLVTFFFFRPPDFREKPKPRRNTFLRQRWWKTFGWKVKFLQRRLDLSCWNLSSWTFIVTCRNYCYLVLDRCSSWDRHCTNRAPDLAQSTHLCYQHQNSN